jgi:hypothetical protein
LLQAGSVHFRRSRSLNSFNIISTSLLNIVPFTRRGLSTLTQSLTLSILAHLRIACSGYAVEHGEVRLSFQYFPRRLLPQRAIRQATSSRHALFHKRGTVPTTILRQILQSWQPGESTVACSCRPLRRRMHICAYLPLILPCLRALLTLLTHCCRA